MASQKASAVHHECQFRDFLDRVGDKWTMLVIFVLEKMPGQRCRFTELKRNVPGISQRMLTTTLRNLERDGLLKRYVYAEVPPRVEYEMTALGRSLMGPMGNLIAWMEQHWSAIRKARDRFDEAHKLDDPGAGQRLAVVLRSGDKNGDARMNPPRETRA